MAATVGGGVPVGGAPMIVLQNNDSVDESDDADPTPSPSQGSPSETQRSAQSVEGLPTENSSQDITFLVEVVKATVPKRIGGWEDNKRRVHCTACWIGPANPSGRRRRESLHRTNSIADNGTRDFTDHDAAVVDCTEHIFTVDDSMLFLLKTNIKQLVKASVDSTRSSDEDDAVGGLNDGGLRFDVFQKTSNMINSVLSTVLADNIAEKEDNAITRGSTSSLSSYGLIGSVFLSPEEILSKCHGKRFECDLMENWRKIHQQQGGGRLHQRISTIKVDGGRLALRIRLASEFDAAFVKSLESQANTNKGVNVSLQTTLDQSLHSRNLKLAQLITEVDEHLLTAQTSRKTISNIAPIAKESLRYLFSNDVEKRLLVKPYPDPTRPEETTWFTEEELLHECYKPSTHWIQAGEAGSCSLGSVYLEVLECRGLPNMDTGGSIGIKSDAFVSVVYDSIMVQTEVIDNSLSPMWMPWLSRAFVFQISHPSTDIFIGVADYDIGPLEHDYIGRATIHMGKLSPGMLYTLTYNLYESSNLTEKGEVMGTITVRLRIEIPNEKKYLMEGLKAPTRKWVNSLQWKTDRMAKYCVRGPHDEGLFEMRVFYSHMNELRTQKQHLTYAISDSVQSLVRWKGQVKVGNVWLPLHSAVVYFFSIHVIENPHFLPSFILFGCGWIMIANMLHRVSHPNPWHRGHSFAHLWNVLTKGKAYHAISKEIRPMQGHEEASKLESNWKQRLADDDEQYAKQAELDAKIETISADTAIRTKRKRNAALVDPISAVAGAKLLPYQQKLSMYCNKARRIRNVMNWNESILSFFFTLSLFGAGFVALFIPWRFLLLWTSRLLVWVGLGPWMLIFDLFFGEEAELQKAKASKEILKLFHERRKAVKLLREKALKMKAFRIKLFGGYITRLPEFNLARHPDMPLPQSFAELYRSDGDIKAVKFIPSQDLSGTMIPRTGQNSVENKARMEEEKVCLIHQYQTMVNEKAGSVSTPEHDLARGYGLTETWAQGAAAAQVAPAPKGIYTAHCVAVPQSAEASSGATAPQGPAAALVAAAPQGPTAAPGAATSQGAVAATGAAALQTAAAQINTAPQSAGTAQDCVVCVHSGISDTAIVAIDETNVTHPKINSERDVAMSDKATRSVLGMELQEHQRKRPPKTKWIFSCSFSFSLKKETIHYDPPPAPSSCPSSRNKQ